MDLRSVVVLMTFFIAFQLPRDCRCQMCSRLSHFTNGQGIQESTKLTSNPFLERSSYGLLQCVRWCRLHTLCRAVNYKDANGTCELLKASALSSTPVNDPNYIAVTNINWNLVDIGFCQNHNCENNEICEPRSNGFTCVVVGCYNSSVSLSNSSVFGSKIYSFGENVNDPCESDYYPNAAVTCQTDGLFSPFECKPYPEIRNCVYLHSQCNPNLPDGEYWLYPPGLGGVMTRIYCDAMFSSPNSFISLPEGNFASRSLYVYDSPTNCSSKTLASATFRDSNKLGVTSYTKVAFSPAVGKLRDDFTFTTSNHTPHAFGKASDCIPESSPCPALGQFQINLTGTGLVVSTSTTWVADDAAATIDINNQGNKLILGTCGKCCKGCGPSQSNLYVAVDPDPASRPLLDSAVRPICTI